MRLLTKDNRYPVTGQAKTHRLVAAKALGHALPIGAVVHHHGGNRAVPDKNLVICENQAYHLFLERRTRAFHAIGDARGLRCGHCNQYDFPENLQVYIMKRGPQAGKTVAQHAACHQAHSRRHRGSKS